MYLFKKSNDENNILPSNSMVWMTSEFDWQHPLGTCVSAEQVELGSGTLAPRGHFLQFCRTTEDKQII